MSQPCVTFPAYDEPRGPQLELRPIEQIEGSFRVARYQRGYRWGQQEVEQLLNDIEVLGKGGDHSLQPVVVQRLADAGVGAG